MATIVEDVRNEFSLSLSADYAARCLQAKSNLTSSELYQKALKENLRDICGTTLLPYGIAAQVSATLPSAVVLQINSSRDVTQPLRQCADVTGEDTILNASKQRNSDKRLLRLLLTDGNSEIPALELSTLGVFRGIPTPGEKVLIHKDAEVRNGCIILSEDNITLLGGEVYQLKQDFLANRSRLEAGYTTSNGLDGAPRFEPLQVGQHYRGNQGVGAAQGAADRQGGVPPQWTNNTGRARGRGFNKNNSNHRGGGGRGGGCGGGRGGSGHASRGYGGGDSHGRARGRGGSRYSGRGGAPPYHTDATDMQPPQEKFPAINETNFPRLS